MKKLALILAFSLICFNVYSQADSCYVIQIKKKNGENLRVIGGYQKQDFIFEGHHLAITFNDDKFYTKVFKISEDSIWVGYAPNSLLDDKGYQVVSYPISKIKRIYLAVGRFAKFKKYHIRAVKIPSPCNWNEEQRKRYEKLINDF
jgi:hypothetical protein